MQMSPSIGKLAEALSKAQGAMRAASKDRENPFFKSHYATLASVIDAIREPFCANQLAFVQPTRVDEHGNVFVTTLIMHASGEWVSGEASAKPAKNDPQGVGSLISYLKRYGLQAMVGVASADEDDDGNAATRGNDGPGLTGQERIRAVVDSFAKFGVTQQMIESHIGSKLLSASEKDFDEVRKFFDQVRQAAAKTPDATGQMLTDRFKPKK